MASSKESGDRHGPPRKILMLTNCELGQATVFLGTCDALLKADPGGVQIHVASFPKLESQISRVSDNARHHSPDAKPIVFHAIQGLSSEQGAKKIMDRVGIPHYANNMPVSFSKPLSFSTTTRAISDTSFVFVPYDGPDMVEVVSSVMHIINQVAADLVVVDALMTASLTACFHLGIKFCCLSPNSVKGFAVPSQSGLARWRFPVLFSGFRFPVPLHLIPVNFYYLVHCAISWLSDKGRRQTAQYVKTHLDADLRSPLDLLRNPPADLKIFVGTHPELDFPLRIPQHIIPCGPISRPTGPADSNDPLLMLWLERGPTVYVNMGSLWESRREQAEDFARSLRCVLERIDVLRGDSKLQVLWKLKRDREDGSAWEVEDTLAPYIESDRVKIVSWIKAEPASILGSGHVVCAVHHCGANSYYEAVRCGIPQVALPQWTDCYDFAELVRLHGVGRIGNDSTKPNWTVAELSREMLAVLHGDTATDMRRNAKQLADLCAQRGSGAETAAAMILRECQVAETLQQYFTEKS
ncbi:hypothetical protein HIM_06129 [Hirsutella minnesotensis 3608]|uniref:Glycosyltransferase family 28 N-terminal domain-containing protein n=1 Tax=Hirsutella minnesotensis 3608 TaxID=1043627 RepID=A0A0F7ZUA7_9HYPO|nr:hypothetical protein HIM_06129 [Hirsutella minnesotensis 3608]